MGSHRNIMLALTVVTACSGGGIRPDLMAIERMEAIARDYADQTEFTIRLSPAPCDCPQTEVRLGRAWYRVFLEPVDPDSPAEAARAILQAAESRGRAGATLLVAGSLSRRVKIAGTRAPCLVLKVISVCESGRCLP